MNLQDKLEEFKKLGMYAVQLFFGEDIGCDDNDVLLSDRNVVVLGRPVGCLGEVQVMFRGNLGDFLRANLKSKPTKLSNPPKRADYDNGGYFIWGVDRSVDGILDKPFFGEWQS